MGRVWCGAASPAKDCRVCRGSADGVHPAGRAGADLCPGGDQILQGRPQRRQAWMVKIDPLFGRLGAIGADCCTAFATLSTRMKESTGDGAHLYEAAGG